MKLLPSVNLHVGTSEDDKTNHMMILDDTENTMNIGNLQYHL